MTVSALIKKVEELRTGKTKACTLLGIGPMSIPVLRAAFELGKEKDFPLMLIASRNQIDNHEFGGGYVCGWNQRQFVDAIKGIAKDTGFNGIYYICRDHGGPWQRDKERADKLPEAKAMEICKQSYLADLIAGFNLLHIDPTKDPHCSGVIPLADVLDRTVELIKYVETERKARHMPPIDYEVGTEETNGGLTNPDTYADFINELVKRLNNYNLPMPAFIVGQTGSLVRMTENVGRFNADTAALLCGNALKAGMGLKEHNADYLPDDVLLAHPVIGVTASNVAPEFGVAETKAYLLLSAVEKTAAERRLINSASDFSATIRNAAVDCERWRKWMTGDVPSMPVTDIKKDSGLVDIITMSSGHYTFEDKAVSAELSKMKSNLSSLGLDPDKIVLDRIKNSISKYVEFFGLTGLTSLVETSIK